MRGRIVTGWGKRALVVLGVLCASGRARADGNTVKGTVGGAMLALLLYGQPILAAVFGAALLINLVIAAVLGTTIPLILDRFGQDPAVASSVFLTPMTDAIGFFVFLGLATVFLL